MDRRCACDSDYCIPDYNPVHIDCQKPECPKCDCPAKSDSPINLLCKSFLIITILCDFSTDFLYHLPHFLGQVDYLKRHISYKSEFGNKVLTRIFNCLRVFQSSPKRCPLWITFHSTFPIWITFLWIEIPKY
jgi:hypothetical protein